MSARLDPVTLEVVRNALPAVANEMAADLQRTSYNMMIYEVRDFCAALVDVNGRLISQNVGGVSHFVADLGVIIEDAIARYGIDGFNVAHFRWLDALQPLPSAASYIAVLLLTGMLSLVLVCTRIRRGPACLLFALYRRRSDAPQAAPTASASSR